MKETNAMRFEKSECLFCKNDEVKNHDAWGKSYHWENLPLFSKIGKTEICCFCLKNIKSALDEIQEFEKEIKKVNKEKTKEAFEEVVKV